MNPSLGRADGCWTIRDGDTVESLWPEHLAPLIVAVLDALARDVRIEVQPDEALARWDSATIFASLGHDGLERSGGGAWA